MAQTWPIPPQGTDRAGELLKTDLPAALESLRTMFAGAAEPTTTTAYMLWADTGNSELKQRNAANTGWVTLGPLLGMLSRQVVRAELLSLSATTARLLWAPPVGFTVTRLLLLSDTTTTSTAGNEWTFSLTNKTDAAELFATDPDTVTDGDLTADTAYPLIPDQNLTLDPDDVLEFTATKAGTATTVSQLVVILEGYFSS
jgi:hypothetical protein